MKIPFDPVSYYGIDRWGDGYFHVSEEGALVVTPDQDERRKIDVSDLVDRLEKRGLKLPVLVRFNGIIKDRIRTIHQCFEQTIHQYGYHNRYGCVFPIKVNQQRGIVEQVVDPTEPFGCGLEAGSKPELVAAIALSDPDTLIICNGLKDSEFIKLALLAQQMGRTVIPVVEKTSELDLILKHAKELKLRPKIGVRVKLATRGSGRWQASGGYRSKFGLTVAEVLVQLDRLNELGMGDCIKLLHFHIGSQISHIRQIKAAVIEASRIYVDLSRRGAGLEYLDVGGGLGVDYDGSSCDHDSSMNYTVQEYANDVVSHVQTICDEAGVEHPHLISESGRAIAAHHSMLVVETVGVTQQGSIQTPPTDIPDHFEQPIHDLWESFHDLTPENMRESFHDAQVALDLCMNLFSGGYLPLEQRAAAENLYFAICHEVRRIAMELPEIPQELQHLDRLLSDIYFINFSLFQSMPDAWAIDQVFPIVPINRLNETPTRCAVLGDLTCDSDGVIDQFVTGAGRSPTLALHQVDSNKPYRLAVMLVGAYQETLSALHNLYGDTHAVHVDIDHQGAVKIESIVKGDSTREVLGYVQYEERDIIARIQSSVEDAVQEGQIDNEQAGQTVAFIEKTLAGYTYLTGESE